jgi:hypothetical protein
MTVDRIWVAWTEDSSDLAAQRLKEEKRMRLQAVHMALSQLARTRSAEAEGYGSAIAQLLGFYGGLAEGTSLAAFSENTELAMKAVTERPNGPSPTFCKPGDVLRPDWDRGLRVYVLGPPRDPAALGDLRGKADTDMYKFAGIDSLYLAALSQTFRGDEPADGATPSEPDDKSFPFHPSLRWLSENKDKILTSDAFAPLYKAYHDEGASWRQIDNEWLVSSARMALQLDNATNNTSLVLAFELDDERVLLFPADAQIGSWRSWLNLQWSAEQRGRSAAITTRDLLQRTIFYKVGHHGSENATRKEDGLETMTDRRLVAAVPVDQNFANHTKKWRMPADPLLRRLTALTKGRILRADAAWPQPDDPPPATGLREDEWLQFRKSVHIDPSGLFIDYMV